MIGYVQNISPGWAHALKRAVRPGGKIPLDELYSQYGKKHSLAEGKTFVDWLGNVKLKDRNRWKIVYDDGASAVSDVLVEESTTQIEKQTEKKPVGKNKNDYTTPIVPKGMSVSDIVELSVRKAREVVPKLTDLKLLQYSLQQASSRSGKDSLCRLLRKRIVDLKTAR